MEGALPSVVGGLVDKPVIAVPTSVGYGTGFGGIAALLGMLNSCTPGVAVVNIDTASGPPASPPPLTGPEAGRFRLFAECRAKSIDSRAATGYFAAPFRLPRPFRAGGSCRKENPGTEK